MAESRREGAQGQKEIERPTDGNQQSETGAARERGLEMAARETDRIVETGREGMRQATEASKAAASGAFRSGEVLAEGAQEITAAWARYAEEVMRHTSEASKALLRARTFNEMLEVQANLLRGNLQAFLDQSTRIAEAASRMATRPFEALKPASGEQTRS